MARVWEIISFHFCNLFDRLPYHETCTSASCCGEALKDDRKGQHSIRINDQWRVCFRWQGEDALDVEIVDYH